VKVIVSYEIEPDRIGGLNLPANDGLDQAMPISCGAACGFAWKTASFVTGSKQLGVGHRRGRAQGGLCPRTATPTCWTPLDDGQADIVSAASSLIARVQAIPFEQIGQNLNQTLAGRERYDQRSEIASGDRRAE